MATNARRFSISLILCCALGACSEKDTASGDGDIDVSALCADLDEAECEARSMDHVDEEHACHPINGRKSCDHLGEDESPSVSFVICEDGGDGDATIPSCAVDPETGDAYTFPSTDNPTDWTKIACDEALDSCEMGGAGGGD